MKISVKAHPKSKKIRVVKMDENHYEVWVRGLPEKGQANEAVIEALSEHFDIPKSKISVMSGHKSKNKVIQID